MHSEKSNTNKHAEGFRRIKNHFSGFCKKNHNKGRWYLLFIEPEINYTTHGFLISLDSIILIIEDPLYKSTAISLFMKSLYFLCIPLNNVHTYTYVYIPRLCCGNSSNWCSDGRCDFENVRAWWGHASRQVRERSHSRLWRPRVEAKKSSLRLEALTRNQERISYLFFPLVNEFTLLWKGLRCSMFSLHFWAGGKNGSIPANTKAPLCPILHK